MGYRVTIAREAAKAFRKIHSHDAARLKVAILALTEDPRPFGSIRLSGGDGEMRIRVGSYRIVYDVHDDELMILVLKIGHRREIYH